MNTDINGADIDRKHRDTEDTTNAPKKDDTNLHAQTSGTRNPEDQELIQAGTLKGKTSNQSSHPVSNNAVYLLETGGIIWQVNVRAIQECPPKSITINTTRDGKTDREFRSMIKTVPELSNSVNNSFPEKNKQIISEISSLLDEAVGSTTSNPSANSNKIPNMANDRMIIPKQNEQNIRGLPILNNQTIGAVINDPSASFIEPARTQNLPKPMNDGKKLICNSTVTDTSGADIGRRYRVTEVVTNAPENHNTNTHIQTSGTMKTKDQELIQPEEVQVKKKTPSPHPVIDNARAGVENGGTTWQNNLGAKKKCPQKSATINKILHRKTDRELRSMIRTVPEHSDTVNNSFPEKNKQIISETSILLDEAVGSTTSNPSANSNKIPNKANDRMLIPKQNEQNIHGMPILNNQTIGAVINDSSASFIKPAGIQNLPTPMNDGKKLICNSTVTDTSGADIGRRYRVTEVVTNAPKNHSTNTHIQTSGTMKTKDQELIQPEEVQVKKKTPSPHPVIDNARAGVEKGGTTWQNNLGATKKCPQKSATINKILHRKTDRKLRSMIRTVPEHSDTVNNSFPEKNKQIISETSILLDEAVGSTTSNPSANSNKIPNKANDRMLIPKQNEQNIHGMPILNDQTIGAVINDPSASFIKPAGIQNLPEQLKNIDKPICNSTVADISVRSRQSPESQVSRSSSRFQTTTLATQQSSSPKLDPPTELFNPLINMFPDVNPNYIAKVCITGKRENQVLETLVEHLLQCGARHPRIVNPEPEPTMFTVDEQCENLQAIFPDAHPEYLRNFAESHWNNPEAMKNFVEQCLENHDYPTMSAHLEKIKMTEQIRRYTEDFDVKNFLEVFPDPFAHFENPARVYEFNVFAVEFLKTQFNWIKVATIRKVYSSSNNQYHISLAAKELESIRKDMKTRRADKPILIEDIPLLQEFAFIRNKNEIRQYMQHQKMTEEREFEELKKENQLLQCQCCFDDECMPRKCFTCTEGHIFCKACILLGTQTKIGEGHLEFPCFTTCSGEFTLEVLQKVVTPTTFSILLRKKQEAEVKAAGLEGLVSCPFCHFASIPPPEDRIFKCLNPDCMKETCRLCKDLNHVPLRCDEITKGEEARHYLEEKMTAALVRKCYRCSRTFFKEEGCNKMTCPCGASMCYICGQPVEDYKHFNGQGSDRVDLCPLWSDNALINAKAVRAVAEAAEKEILVQNPNLKIDATALMPKLPTPTKGPHQDIPNAHILPVHVRNGGHANVLR